MRPGGEGNDTLYGGKPLALRGCSARAKKIRRCKARDPPHPNFILDTDRQSRYYLCTQNHRQRRLYVETTESLIT